MYHDKPVIFEYTSEITESSNLYQPIWLRKSTLAAFAILFALLSATLIALWRIVSTQNGLSLSLTSSHYAWTYGPTAVLIIVVSLWRQVDYYCKLTQSWREMTNKQANADQSVLLDYISTNRIISLFKSLHRGHFPVSLSITGFFFLNLSF